MAHMPGAAWRPIPTNYTRSGQSSVRGVVVHIMAGTLAGTDSWFRNPKARASSHFGTGRAGALYQWVDTADRAWAQAAGNTAWLSVENEGKAGDTLTTAQLDANARVLAWAHKKYGVPLKVATSTSDRGLAYHALGGSAWGGHTSCPGARIVAQLPDIVARAKKLVGEPDSEELDMDKDQVFAAVWKQDKAPAPTSSSTLKKNPTWQPINMLRELYDRVHEVLDKLNTVSKRLDALEKKAGK
ncbi:N-acetylmuramoyl-L-alanine amidase [Streptomyces albus]